MVRLAWAFVAAVLLCTSCSSGETSAVGGGADGPDDVDPGGAFCDEWRPYEQLINSDSDVDEELVALVLGMEEGLQAVVPGVLEDDLAASVDWNARFIDWFERNDYREMTDEEFIELFGGDEDLGQKADDERTLAFENIEAWVATNCAMSENDHAFCQQWPPYVEFVDSVESVEVPTEELVAQLLVMEDSISRVLPGELGEAWRGVVDWNTAFLDLLERIGYRPITDEIFLEAFDGDEERAAAAVEAREAGFEAINRWVATNCGGGGGDTNEPAGALPVRFCAAWDEFLALTADDAELDQGQWEQLKEIVDRASARVPAAVADEWTAITDFVDRYGDVLVSVEFREERITDDMLEQAFGSVEAYDQAVAARDAAGEAIALWSLEGCGGFCARWSDTREALDHFVYDLGWVGDSGDEGPQRVDEMEGRLVVAGQMVDAEIRADWDALTAAIGDWVGLWSSVDYDRQRLETAKADGRLRALIADSSYLDGIVETIRDFHLGDERLPWDEAREWLAGRREAPGWLAERVGDPDQWFDEAILRAEPREWLQGSFLRIQEWVDANCAASSGGPGRLQVRYPRVEGRAGGTVLLALLPLGGSYEDLADVPGTIAAQCEAVGSDPWGVWIEQHEDESGDLIVEETRREGEPFRDERWSEDRLCDFDHEAAPPLIDAGRHTLVAGIMWGQPGDPAEGIELVSCLEVDIQIDADTIVDLPPFEACDVRIGGGEPDPWRHPPPVDPSTPGSGTLKVLMSELVMPAWTGSRDHGQLMVVALPAGATLNEVGRQQLWPAAAVATWLPPAGSGSAQELARHGSALLPLGVLPPSGRPAHLELDWLAQDPQEDRLPLTLLAPGSYNVRFELVWQVDERDEVPAAAKVQLGQASLCAESEVIVDGDTVIDMPELGECP